MKTHYSVISASIRPEIGERIAIGLLLVGSEKIIFRFSKNKVNVLKELINDNAFKFLKESLKQITNMVDMEEIKVNTLFTQLEFINSFFTENYLEYLNRYSNNLLNFTAPKIIELPATEELFISLFKKYIDESVYAVDTSKVRTFDTVKADFFPRFEKYYNLEQELTPGDFPSLPMPIKIDIIGKNDGIVYAQIIDLERILYHIRNDIGVLAILSQTYKKKAEKFVISNEPDKKNYPKQHQTWIYLRKSDMADYIDLSEMQKIEDYAITHGVLPLFQQ